ncbi:MAG: DUF6152 family protein [Elioraea sp.]|nr:DUF6152 family protein [Elioraea sp.]MDW8443322.1 DUF6152 family protein [Acetobacteraceae bacterium]
MTGRRMLLAALLTAGVGLPAAAHHGWGAYDAQNPQTLTGTIERIAFANPHATLWLATPGKTWEVVLAPPFRMTNRGLTEAGLVVGASVTVMGYPHRERADELRAEWIRVGERTTQLR